MARAIPSHLQVYLSAIQPKGDLTDSSGRFEISGLSNGNYNVIVSFVGYETQIYPISVNEKNDNVLFVMKENAKELRMWSSI